MTAFRCPIHFERVNFKGSGCRQCEAERAGGRSQRRRARRERLAESNRMRQGLDFLEVER